MIDYNYDALSTNVKRYALSEMRTSSGVETSKIYVQTANKNNEYYLRFATAVKGDVTSIKFTRELIGVEETETVKAVKTKEIDTLYKGISSGEETSYFSGSQELIDQQITSTKDYYWACYTIKFSENSTYLSTPIRMTLSINNKEIKTRTTSFNDELNNIYNGDLVDYLDLAGDNYNITLKKVSDNIKSDPYKIPQGGCTDGKYLYYALNKMGSEETQLVKYDIYTKTAKFSDVIHLGNQTWTQTSGKTFFYNNMIGLITQDGSIKFFDKETLKENTTQTLKFTGALNTANIYDISYNEKIDKFVLINRNGNMYFANNDLVTYDSGAKIAINDVLNDISTDDNYIYAVGGKDGLIGGNISIYDWDGNIIKEKIIFNDTDNKTGITLNQGVNVQSVIRLNDKYYCAVNRYNDDGLFICELEIDSSKVNYIPKYNFNDMIEYSNMTANYNVSAYFNSLNKNGIKTTIQKETYYSVRNVSFDDKYLYVPVNNNGAKKGILIKYDIQNMKEVCHSTTEYVLSSNSSWGRDPGSSFIYNDTIYVIKKDGSLLAFDKDLNPKENTLNLKLPANATLYSVIYNKDKNKFAILDTNYNLYFAEIGSEATKVLTLKTSKYDYINDKNVTEVKNYRIESISSDGNYIYSIASGDNVNGFETNVIDWEGNLIKEKLILKGEINSNMTNGGYNIQQAMFMNNKSYVVGLSFSSDTGAYILESKFSFNK
ncbi:MAG: hypothetical protein V8R16_08090 [Bacilli bacterium]